MITTVVQRWRDRRGSYRPAGEPIATRLFEVSRFVGEVEPKAFVLHHHYAASFPAARFSFGLHRGGRLVGVAVFSHPVNVHTFDALPGAGLERCELGRLVLLDEVPANGESWFVARCFEELHREGIVGVVSFSDPVARANAAGDVVFRGHIGTVYQASNATYVGRSKPETKWLLPDGSMLHARTLAKIRKGDRGSRNTIALLERLGADPLSGDAGEWLARALPTVALRVRHGGNLKYLFALDRRARRLLPPSLPYPKFDDALGARRCA